MSTLLRFILATLILAHFGFAVMEWFWLDLPVFQERLGFDGPQEEVAIVAKNQAFSNLVLAAGLVLGWRAFYINKQSGVWFVVFMLASIALAGVIGYVTIKKGTLAFLAFQTLPASAGLALLWLEQRMRNNSNR